MNLRNTSADRLLKIPTGYRILQGIVRLGVRIFFPKIRLLNQEQFQPGSPAFLAVNYPESLSAALILMAAAGRPVLCLISPRTMGGFFRKFLGRRLGIIPADPSASSGRWAAWLASALDHWETLAMFTGNSSAGEGAGTQDANSVAKLVFETLQQSEQQLAPTLYPVHAFLPPDRRKSCLLVYVDAPIREESSSAAATEGSTDAPQRLSLAARIAMQKNAFALEQLEIEHFHREIEDIAHEDLEQEWDQRPDWKQQAQEFQLSGFMKQWIRQQNQVNPARLVALRTLLEDYREERRRCSLGRMQVETSSLWQKSSLLLAATWVESLLGFPVALYGLLNHIPAGIILYLTGLLKKSTRRDPKVDWLMRCSVVMGCYILQVWIFDVWLGRAAAGYYTLTLPLSGAYLWRYLWLARNRSRLLLLKATLPARSARLRRTRKALLEKFDGEVNHYTQSLGMPS